MLHLLWILKHMVLLPRIQVSLRVWIRTSRRSTWHHAAHYWPRLADLWPTWSSYSWVHLLSHGDPWLLPTTWHTLVGWMAVRHGMTAMNGHSRLVWERLCHARHRHRFYLELALAAVKGKCAAIERSMFCFKVIADVILERTSSQSSW